MQTDMCFPTDMGICPNFINGDPHMQRHIYINIVRYVFQEKLLTLKYCAHYQYDGGETDRWCMCSDGAMTLLMRLCNGYKVAQILCLESLWFSVKKHKYIVTFIKKF